MEPWWRGSSAWQALSSGGSGRPAGGKKAHCGLQMVHGLDWKREKGMETDRLTKTASTHPHLSSPIDPHDSTATEESPSCVGQEGGRWWSHPCTAGLQHQGPSLREKPNLHLMENEYNL